MENCLSLIPKSFVSLLSPEVEVLHEDASNSPSHRPKPSNAVYYNTFLKCVLTPIALVALPLIALIALIYSVSYCLIKKISFQDLVARKLALLALSIDPKSLEAIRIEKKPNEIVTSIFDGIELSGVQILRDESTKWVVALNGTTGTWEGNLDSLSSLSKLMNANVVSFNYRGVGKSKGYCRSSENIICDGIEMVKFLKNKAIPESDIIIYGHSLGGGVGAQVVAQYDEIKLINDRSFSSFEKATKTFFWLPVYREIVSYINSRWWKLDSYKALSNVDSNRCLIVLAKQDYIIQGDGTLYSDYLRNKKIPPQTITLEYPIPKNLCCLSRCNQLGRTHIWDLPQKIEQNLRKFIGTTLEEQALSKDAVTKI